MSNTQSDDAALEDSDVLSTVLGDALPQLRIFHQKLLEEGETRGLIGPRDVDIIWERHILNSAAVIPYIRDSALTTGEHSVADVGSGGGFPGLVAATCLPDFQWTLIEPMERRVVWLQECVELMGLTNVTVLRNRSEEVITRQRHHTIPRFGVVTCRAVAPMKKLSAWTLPLLLPGGSLVALKGRSAQEDLDKGRIEIAKFGGVDPTVVQVAVGPGCEPTHVIVVRKR